MNVSAERIADGTKRLLTALPALFGIFSPEAPVTEISGLNQNRDGNEGGGSRDKGGKKG